MSYINKEGLIILETQFIGGGPFSEGLAMVYDESTQQAGMIDINGNVIIRPQFDGLDYFINGYCPLMWFKENGHFAKNGNTESEVSHECSKKQTKIHQRIQSGCCRPCR